MLTLNVKINPTLNNVKSLTERLFQAILKLTLSGFSIFPEPKRPCIAKKRPKIKKKVLLKDPKPAEKMMLTFRKIRRMRMKPAHKVDEDKFEQEYFKKQREVMIEAYSSIRTLRLIFANHPKTKSYKIPEWLFKGEIWDF